MFLVAVETARREYKCRAPAFFHTLVPEPHSAKRGESVREGKALNRLPKGGRCSVRDEGAQESLENAKMDRGDRQGMMDALAVDGLAAWIVHGAIKLNGYRDRKGQSSFEPECPSPADLEYHSTAQQATRPSTSSDPAEISAEERIE